MSTLVHNRPVQFTLTSAMVSQFRDLADNDNQSDADKVRCARDLQKWASFRAQDVNFATLCLEAAKEAQDLLRQTALRTV